MVWKLKQTPFLKRGGVFCFHRDIERPMIKNAIATFLFILVILLTLLCPSLPFAEVKEIIAEGTYIMGPGETPMVAQERALLDAKRTAIEQTGTYIESYSKVVNLQVTHDEINVLSSGVLEVTTLDAKKTDMKDGTTFWVRIKSKVVTATIEEMAVRIKEKSTLHEDYLKIQRDFEKNQSDIKELKKKLKEAYSEKEKAAVQAKITDSERGFW